MSLFKLGVKTLAATSLTLLVGCGSMGGLGGVLGGDPNGGTYPQTRNQSSILTGTVNNVDTRNQRIDMTVYSMDGQSSGGRSTSIAYDTRTLVTYQNQRGTPANLERGDRVEARVYNDGNGQYVADSITVTQSVSSNGSPNNTYPTYPSTSPSYPGGSQTSDIQGTVASIDTRNQRIELNVSYINNLRNSRSNFTINYDNRTRVLYGNETHPVGDLEPGDQVSIRTYNDGSQSLADTITVTRNVRQ